MAKTKDRLLVLEAEPAVQERLTGLLGRFFAVEAVSGLEQARESAGTGPCAAVIAAYAVPEIEGELAWQRLRGATPADVARALEGLRAVAATAAAAAGEAAPGEADLAAQARDVRAAIMETLEGRLLQSELERDAERDRLAALEKAAQAALREKEEAGQAQNAAEAAAAQALADLTAQSAELEALRGQAGAAAAERDRLAVALAESQAHGDRLLAEAEERCRQAFDARDAALLQYERARQTAEKAESQAQAATREKQQFEKDSKRLYDDMARSMARLEGELLEAAQARDKAIAEKAEAETKLAKMQEHWERIANNA